MLELLLIILLVAWLTGWRFYPAGGNAIHVLLVIFVIILIARLLHLV
jgi:hypothetical protein